MKSLFLYAFIILMSTPALAQKSKDLQAIQSLCGCFEVEFKYAETFSPIENYEFHDRYYAKAVEYAFPLQVSEDKVVIQHVLALRDTIMIKHWREDWIFEEQNLYSYQGDNIWFHEKLNKDLASGTWTQKVYGVNDEPRYEGAAEWSHVNNKSTWESKVDSPLPRREYSKRSDYNVMARGNRIHVYGDNYVHEQDNDKISRIESEDVLIASEKGYNNYNRTDPAKCAYVETWWSKNEAFWKDVRAAWELRFDEKTPLKLKQFSRTKLLTEYMSELSSEYEGTDEDRQKIVKVIQGFTPSPEVPGVSK